MMIPPTGPRVDATPTTSSTPRIDAASAPPEPVQAPQAEAFQKGYALEVQDLSAAQMARVIKRTQDTAPAEPVWVRPSSSAEAPTAMVPDAPSLCLRDGDSVAILDPATGKETWKTTVPGGLPEKALGVWQAADGTVLVAGKDNILRGLDGSTGQESWSFDLGDRFVSPVFIQGNSIAVLRKSDDQLQLCRLDTAGKVGQTVPLGGWDSFPGTDGCSACVSGVDPQGNLLVRATVKLPPKPGETYSPNEYSTFVVTPYGHVPFGYHGLDPIASYNTDPDRVYTVEYGNAGAYNRNDGTWAWQLTQEPEWVDPKWGAMGNKLWKVGGQAEYKYIKFADAREGHVIIQGYKERTRGVTQTGEDLICVDATNPDRALWRASTEGSVFRGPLYVDGDLLIHVKNDKDCIIEALDPATGTSKWQADLRDPQAGERVTGSPAPGFVSVSRESAGNYSIQRGKDGTVFVRTFKGIFGLDPNTGLVKQGFKASHEIRQYVLTPDERGVLVTNNETSEVRLYPMETQEERVQKAVDAVASEDAKTEAGPSGKVEMQASEVVINGIRIPRHISTND